MTAEENIENTKAAYAAFAAADIDAASADLADDIEWTVTGESPISGVYHGKEEVIAFWIKLAEKGFTTEPQHFLGQDDMVVVLSTTTQDGETSEEVDILDFQDGKVVKFRSVGDTLLQQKVWGSK